MKRVSNPHAKRLVLLVWVLVLIFYFYLSYDYLRVQMTDDKFDDALQHIVQLAGSGNRTNKEIRALILVRAEQLNLPIRGDQIAIVGAGPTLNVRVNYRVDIEIPVLQSTVYTKEINHFVQYQVPNRF